MQTIKPLQWKSLQQWQVKTTFVPQIKVNAFVRRPIRFRQLRAFFASRPVPFYLSKAKESIKRRKNAHKSNFHQHHASRPSCAPSQILANEVACLYAMKKDAWELMSFPHSRRENKPIEFHCIHSIEKYTSSARNRTSFHAQSNSHHPTQRTLSNASVNKISKALNNLSICIHDAHEDIALEAWQWLDWQDEHNAPSRLECLAHSDLHARHWGRRKAYSLVSLQLEHVESKSVASNNSHENEWRWPNLAE